MWKIIPDNKNYSVSRSGEVKNNKTGKQLKPCKIRHKSYGYIYRVLCGKKNYTLHSLVFKVFNKMPMNGKCFVTFLDGDSLNCSFKNLLFGRKEKLKRKIKNLDGEEWKDSVLAPEYKVSNMGRVSKQGFEVYLSWCHRGQGRAKERGFLVNKNGRQRWLLVKREVYTLFGGGVKKNDTIYHINGHLDNNNIENLANKTITRDDAIFNLQNSLQCAVDKDGVLAALSLLERDNSEKLNKYFEENYHFFHRESELSCFKNVSKKDAGDFVQDVWLELPVIIKRGTYKGEYPLRNFIVGVIRKRILKRAYTRKDVSLFHTSDDGGECLLSDFNGIDDNTMDWDSFK